MSFDRTNITEDSLTALAKEQLVQMVMSLHETNVQLIKSSDAVPAGEYDKRLEKLERELNKDHQYGRRDSLEIVGIKHDVEDVEIEETCLKILKAAKVKVGNRFAGSLDIHAETLLLLLLLFERYCSAIHIQT